MELKDLTDKMMELLGIGSVGQMPDALMEIVINNKTEYYDGYRDIVPDLSRDWLQKIWQYHLADRKGKMQDYTPASLARFVGRLVGTGDGGSVYDLCAGSGALTIQKWEMDHDLHFVCYEYDKKVIPLLLFNLAVRDIDALVINGDALQDETFTRYTVKRGEKYGTVTEIAGTVHLGTSDLCISNPPYNMKWKLPPFAQLQPRFNNCELPPESNANYAFILTALDRCSRKASMILPRNVLSSEDPKEIGIRRYLIEENLIGSVIACPDKMFESTSIPVCILTLDKKKTTALISFVDMGQTYEIEQREQRGQYGGASHEGRVYKKEVKVFTDEQMQRAMDSIAMQEAVPGYARSVSIQTVAEAGYSLAPSRYIDLPDAGTTHREYGLIIDDLNHVIREKNVLKLTVNETLAKALGLHDVYLMARQSEGIGQSMCDALSFTGKAIEKEDYIAVSKKAGELRFENKGKDTVSTILLSILQMWRQHIMYLNNEENRYLAELRDALLPDLMSGKIQLGEVGAKDPTRAAR